MSPLRSLLALLVATTPGCFGVIRIDVAGPVPTEERLQQIVPGETTARQAIALLGPPEEFRSPTWPSDYRVRDLLGQRVWAERELFGRRQLTWSHESRDTDLFQFPPILPLIYRWARENVTNDTVVLVLDDQGTVIHVTSARETDS